MVSLCDPAKFKPDYRGRALAIDTEDTGLDPQHGDRPYIVSACNSDAQEWLWEWNVDPHTRKPHIPPRDVAKINLVISQHDQIVFHNANFDLAHLQEIGVKLPLKNRSRVHDTQLMSHVLDSKNSHELKELALRFLDILDDDEADLKKAVQKVHRHARKVGWEVRGEKEDAWMLRVLDRKDTRARTYAARDAERTIRLYLLFQELIRRDGLDAQYERERRLRYAVYDMQQHGISIYLPAVRPEKVRFKEVSAQSEKAVQKVAAQFGMEDFNVRSPIQLPKLLYSHLKLPVVARTKPSQKEPNGNPSTDKEALKYLIEAYADEGTIQHHTLHNVRSYRQASKAHEYLEEYYQRSVRNGRSRYATLHTSLNQVGTSTTRFSSKRPNGQNISGKDEMPLRAVFSPPPGFVWLDLDYSNIELRLFAWLAEEKSLIEAFEKGESVHMVICEALFGKGIDKEDPRYKRTKNGNFSIIYGAGEARADATYGIQGAYKRIRKLFPGLRRLTDRCKQEVADVGYVKTLFGYRLYCEKGHSALNYKIQGTAGDVMKYGMINIANNIRQSDARMILTVHDELILQVPKRRYNQQLVDDITLCMEAPGKLISIPTPVSAALITDNWQVKQAA